MTRKRRTTVNFIVTLPLPEGVKMRDLANLIRECIRNEGYHTGAKGVFERHGSRGDDAVPGPLYAFGDRVTVKPWTP